MIAGITLITIGFFAVHSVASGWIGQLADGAKGHASALYLLVYYLGSSVLGSLGGVFWEAGQWPWVCAFAFDLLATSLYFTLRSLPGFAREDCSMSV